MTSLQQTYRDISDRHLRAAQEMLRQGLHEIAVFHCYHAFEAIACATISAHGRSVPRKHKSKINAFVVSSRRFSFATSAAVVASIVTPLRNKALYPETNPGIQNPSQTFSATDAQDLLRRVRGVVQSVITQVGL